MRHGWKKVTPRGIILALHLRLGSKFQAAILQMMEYTFLVPGDATYVNVMLDPRAILL
jgi:hypothetical protein